MSLYNLTKIEGPDIVAMLQGFNSYTDGFAFTVIAFAIWAAMWMGIYSIDEQVGRSLTFSSFAAILFTIAFWFLELVPIYVPFVFLSFLVVGIFTVKVSD